MPGGYSDDLVFYSVLVSLLRLLLEQWVCDFSVPIVNTVRVLELFIVVCKGTPSATIMIQFFLLYDTSVGISKSESLLTGNGQFLRSFET